MDENALSIRAENAELALQDAMIDLQSKNELLKALKLFFEQCDGVLRAGEIHVDDHLQFIRSITSILDDSDKANAADDNAFNMFWDAYPRKVGKPAAFTKFKRAKCAVILPQLLDAIAKQKQTNQWTKDNGEFIPHPSTWLNQRRWEDHTAPQVDCTTFR
jgi:hypothetical protein